MKGSANPGLAVAIAALAADKRAVGYKYDAEEWVLARFEAFCRAEFPGLETVTKASAEAWITAARERGVRPATLQGLAAPVRELARWLGRRGTEAYVLPARMLPRPARYVPHIYTDRELADLFAQTDRCRYSSEAPFRHLVMPVLFRTVYACGLRSSEARLLRPGDVDVSAGVLQVRDAKGGKDRQVPVSGPLRERLGGYHARMAGQPGWEWFFPGSAGQPLALLNVYKNFRRFLWQARISHGGRGHGLPRPRSKTHVRGQQPADMVRRRRGRQRAAAGPAGLHGPFLDRRHRLLPEADRRVLSPDRRPRPARVRRHRAARHRRAAPWRLTSRSPCAASSPPTWPGSAAAHPARSPPTATRSSS
ncbi:tyrosine-type recombinase/integrase [Nonomuraea sp. H19]|uniref:tyrosine-type recombinase/integrase n=1 Tax=Nonomuraea sp. H19 TaxID=3452206 RepID=UPI003F8A74F7